jgi:hypothetical protein
VNDGMRLYFIRNPLTGMVKIGVSSYVPQRREDLSAACGVLLDVLADTARYGRDMEAALHGMFHETRAYGEWFHPSPALDEVIAAAQSKQFGRWAMANRRALTIGKAREIQRKRTVHADATGEARARRKRQREMVKARDARNTVRSVVFRKTASGQLIPREA